ncbi:MAG TPA: AAA family ATPase [Acidimicrobiales bacterium]|nr:AAA family ATPase [Acidimicrobiales bacterium]
MAVDRLVGRDRELTRLAALVDAAAAGTAAVVALVGPAGIGKTRLADAATTMAAERGLAVRWSTAWPGPGAPALWPWIQILRSAGTSLPSATGRSELFDAVVQLVLGAAADQPSLLVLDDIHAADTSSIELLDLLIRQRRGHALGIIVTHRPGEAPPSLAAALRDAEILDVRGLDRPAVAELLATAVPDVPSGAIDRLVDATGGNPFFLLELARALGSADSADALPLPATVLDVIDRHLALVPDDVRDVLAAAAVQGRTFDIAVVAGVLELDRRDVEQRLEQAVEVGLLVATGRHDRFVHGLTAEAVLRSLDRPVLETLHLRTATLLHDPEARAHHLAAAGAHGDRRERVQAARQAAAVARSRFAHDAEASHLEIAVDAARNLDESAVTIDLLIELCEARKASRDLVGARRAALDAAALARSIADDTRLARAALTMPPDTESIEVDQLADPEQIALREEALVRLPHHDDALAARLMAGLAVSLYWASRTGARALDHRATAARRDQLTAAALERARRTDDDATLAACLAARLGALWGPDAPADRSALVAELQATSARVGDGALRLEALSWAVVDAMIAGDHRRACAAVAEHARLADLRRDPVARWTSLRWQAGIALVEGRLDEAEALATEALAAGSDVVGEAVALLFYTVPIGFIRFLQGRLGEAFEFVRAQAADPTNVPAWRAGYALVALSAGHTSLAASEIRALATDHFAALPRDLDWLSSLVVAAPVVESVGDVDSAKMLLDLLEPFADDHAVVGLGYTDYGPVRRALALVRATVGDRDAAITDLRRCLAELDAAQHGLRALCEADLLRLQGGTEPEVVFRRSGDRWVVGRTATAVHHALPALRGVPLLHELLAHDGDVLALELLWAVEPPDDPDPTLQAAVTRSRGEPVLDERAKSDYRRRINDLTRELESADRAGAADRSSIAARELDLLEAELARATGLRGRDRRTANALERARTSVTKLVRRAIEAVHDVDPVLGEHLRAAVHTGTVCRYAPPADDRYHWVLD